MRKICFSLTVPSSLPPEPLPASAITLRREEPADEPLLFKLYCSSRVEEIAAWGWPPAQQEAFLKMQFNGRRHSYRAQFPEADGRIILLETNPIGRLLVYRTTNEIVVIDIALLPEHRNRGIGSAIMRGVLTEPAAAQAKVRLHVLKSSPAGNLYTRLGFVRVGEDELYFQMERTHR